MLTPEELEVLPDNIVKHFSDLETYIIADIIRRIKETGTITETALAQIKTLQSMNVFLADIEEAIQETLHISNMELDRMYNEVLKRNQEFDRNLREKMDLLLPEGQEFQAESYINAVKRQTKEDFYNLTQSLGFAVKVNNKTVFKPIAQYYQDALDNTQIKIVSGGVDYNTAIKEAVDQLTNSGLRTVDYASGWTNQIDVAVRRATLTGVHQVTGYIAQQIADDLDTDLVEVSAHVGARDKGVGPMNHKSWQGKVYSMKGDSEKYPNLARVTGYGTGEGLKGWNCRHSFYPFVEGASTRAYTDEQLQNIDPPDFEYEGRKYTAYEATQKQRQLEAAIRNSKRKLLGYQEAGLKDEFVAESIRLNRLRKYYQDFSNKAGLKTQFERTQVAGFGKSISAKAASAARTVENGNLQDNQERGIMQSGAISGGLNPYSKRARLHAKKYYESVRHMTTDAERIADNTGYSKEEILNVKKYVFEDKHDLGEAEPERFYPSYEMAESWQRLIDGKNIQQHDLTLINHELYEKKLVDSGLSQKEAHEEAEKIYNYKKESDEYYANIEKHKKRK